MVLSKRINKVLSVVLTVLLLMTNSISLVPAFAEEDNNSSTHTTESEKINQFVNQLVPYFFKQGKLQGPQWLKTTDFNLTFTEDYKPIYSLETIQPIGKVTDKGELWFWQGRYAHQSDNNTANLGIGWRKLSEDKTRIVGVNTFYDYGFQYNLSRVGIGAEYFKGLAEYRLNYYMPVSGDKQTGVSYTDAGILRSYIRAVEGLDYEVGTSLKKAPWMKLYASGFYYDNKHHGDETGYRLRNSMQITPRFSVELGYTKSNQNSGDFYGKFTYQLADKLGPSLYGANKEDSKQETDLSYKLLQKVERNNTIKTETFTELEAYTGSIKVTVTNSGSKPMQGVLLQAYQNNSPVGSAVRTDAAGIGILSGLSIGTYTVKATYFSDTKDSNQVTVQKNQTASTEIKLPIVGGSMIVNVLDSNGQPIVGATVTAHSGSGLIVKAERSLFDRLLGVKTAYAAEQSFTIEGITGADGRVRFNDLPPGDYRFVVSVNGKVMQSISAKVPPSGGTRSVVVIVDSGSANNGNAVITVTDGWDVLSDAAVSVKVNGSMRSVKTDPLGRAIVNDLPAGDYTFNAGKNDYNSSSINLTIHNKETAVGKIILTPSGGSVRVKVEVEGGTGITPNFTVDGNYLVADVVSGNVYTFNHLAAGSHTIDAWYTGYTGNGEKTVVVEKDKTTDVGTITLTRDTGSAKITVVDGGINPVKGAEVKIAGTTITATTDDKGEAIFDKNIPTGFYTFTAKMDGYADGELRSVTISKGVTVEWEIQIIRDTGGAKITVVDGGNKPVIGAEVSVEGTGITATTDGFGRAIFYKYIPTGSRTFTAKKADYAEGKVSGVTITKESEATAEIKIIRDTGSAKIKVIDDKNNPVAGAEVKLADTTITATTNANGEAFFDKNLPTGSPTFIASKNGYAVGYVSGVKITKDGTATATIEMTRDTGMVSIKVIDGNKQPVFGVEVRIAGTSTTATTDANGLAIFGERIPTGTYDFTASKEGYPAATVKGVIISMNEYTDAEITIIRDTGTAKIKVIDGNDNPVKGATVNVEGTTITATTGDTGEATLADIPTRTNYTFYVYKEGYSGVRVTGIQISKGENILPTTKINYYTGSANITVTDSIGVLVEGATVSVSVNGKDITATTDNWGEAFFDKNVPTGTHTFTASKAGYTSGKVENVTIYQGVTVNKEIKITRDTGSAKITVVNGRAEPVEGAEVSVKINGTTIKATTDPKGEAIFDNNIPTGSYIFTVSKAGYNDGKVEGVEIVKNGTAAKRIFIHGKNGSAQITVKAGTAPIEGAEVSVIVNGTTIKLRTNSEGKVLFDNNIPTGLYTFTVNKDGYTGGSREIGTSNGSTAYADIQITRDTGDIKITVIQGNKQPVTGATILLKELNITLLTNEVGDADFKNIPTGIYTFVASMQNYADGKAEKVIIAKGSNAGAAIELIHDVGSLKVTVVGSLLGPTEVWVGNTRKYWYMVECPSDGMRILSFNNLTTGTFNIDVICPEYTSDGTKEVMITKTATAAVTFNLTHDTGDVTITVTDKKSKAGVVGAEVWVNHTDDNSNIKLGNTGTGGKLSQKVKIGNNKFTVKMDGYSSVTSDYVNISKGGNTLAMEIQRDTGAIITIRNANPTKLPVPGVKVTVEGTSLEGTTDNSGIVKLLGMTPGNYIFVGRKDNNKTISPSTIIAEGIITPLDMYI